MQRLFGTADLGAMAWIRIVLFGAVVFVLVELEKWLLRARLLRQGNVKA
jgi:hypothetical protein